MNEFSWVKARGACSPQAAFHAIRLGAETDVRERNELRGEDRHYKFGMTGNDVAFVVFAEAGGAPIGSLTFDCTAKGIRVLRPGGDVFMEGVLTVNDDGECRLRVKDQELLFWQFRKRALESLFFESF